MQPEVAKASRKKFLPWVYASVLFDAAASRERSTSHIHSLLNRHWRYMPSRTRHARREPQLKATIFVSQCELQDSLTDGACNRAAAPCRCDSVGEKDSSFSRSAEKRAYPCLAPSWSSSRVLTVWIGRGDIPRSVRQSRVNFTTSGSTVLNTRPAGRKAASLRGRAAVASRWSPQAQRCAPPVQSPRALLTGTRRAMPSLPRPPQSRYLQDNLKLSDKDLCASLLKRFATARGAPGARSSAAGHRPLGGGAILE